MNLLLDTHVLLWLLGEPVRLSHAAHEAIANPGNRIFVSAISSFEIATKYRLGKLPGAESLLLAFPEFLRELNAGELPFSAHHGLVAGRLEWDHRDPFDRILAAQSAVEGMPLVTSDAAFSSLRSIHIVW